MSGTDARRGTALITGASAGIGAALARGFHAAGYTLILTARRREPMDALAAELGGARVIASDLADPGAPERLHAETGPVDLLVNNAGFGAAGRFDRLDLSRQIDMLQVNVAALTALTRLYLPGMLSAGAGRVLNVASVAAFQPGPGLAVYCATKAYVLSLSEALHAELSGTGVTVTCLCPGATRSEFADVAGMNAARLFRHAMAAEAVAADAVSATLAGRRLVVSGLGNRVGSVGVRFMPRGAVLAIARKVMGAAV